jgi:hypothetical protein
MHGHNGVQAQCPRHRQGSWGTGWAKRGPALGLASMLASKDGAAPHVTSARRKHPAASKHKHPADGVQTRSAGKMCMQGAQVGGAPMCGQQ